MKSLLLTFAFFMFFAPSQAFSQAYQKWQWLHPKPQGNDLNWVKVWNANTWYATGMRGTFIKTTNAGQNWFFHHQGSFAYNDGGTEDLLDAHFMNPNTGITVGRDFIYRTTNGGITFNPTDNPGGTTDWQGIYFLDNQTGYVVGSSRIAKTTNGGINFSLMSTDLPLSGRLHDIFTWDNINFVAVGNQGRLFTSTNGGTNWHSHPNVETFMKVNFFNTNTGYIAGFNGTILITTNAGANWSNIRNDLPAVTFTDIDFKYNPSFSQYDVYITGDRSIMFHTRVGQDGSFSWDSLPISPTINQQRVNDYILSSEFIGDTIVSVGTRGLINKYNSPGNVVAYNHIIRGMMLYDIWAESKNGVVLAIGADWEGEDQILRSSNGGINWTYQHYPKYRTEFKSIDMINNLTGYIAGDSGAVYRTSNSGVTWDSVVITGNPRVSFHKVDFININTGWVFGGSSSFKTTNGGLSWVMQTVTEVNDIRRAYMVNQNIGWVAGSSVIPKFAKTTNGGNTWFAQNPGITGLENSIGDIEMFDENTGYVSGGQASMKKTTDGGANWSSMSTPFNEYYYGTIDFINPMEGMVVSSFGMIMLTRDGGITWEIHNTQALQLQSVYMLEDGSAFASGHHSCIFKFDETITGNAVFNTEIPNDYILYQNYPNPFNPETTIKFSIPKSGKVTLKIFDMTGRTVEMLYDNVGFNAGTLSHKFNGSNLSSGIYFYSLIVDGRRIDTKKMVIVK